MDAGAFSVDTTIQNNAAWLALRGELDMSVTDLMSETLAKAEGEGVSLVALDLRDLTFIDSSGLRTILQAWQRAELNGHQLRVVGASKIARRMFEITQMEFLIDEAQAVSTLDRSTDGDGSLRARVASAGDQDA